MEDYNDLVASIILGSVLVALIIPLVGVLRHTNRERKRLDGVKSAKKPEAPQHTQAVLHEDW